MLLKYITFRKIKLLFQLRLSYYLSYWLKKDIRWGRYVSLSIEPTNACNLSCPQCPTGTDSLSRSKGVFDMKVYKALLEEKAKDLIYLNFYFQGEPFINKDLIEMIAMASKQNIYTSVSTNAQLIDEKLARKIVGSGLNRIIISIDGADQETYEKYRKGGQLQAVLDACKYISEAKRSSDTKPPKIVFQFLVFANNEHQLEDIKRLSMDYGVDKLEIKSAQIYDYENNVNLIPKTDKYSRYRKGSDGKYRIKSNLQHKCWRMWHSAVVTQNTDIVPCCFDKDADYTVGNIKNQKLAQIENANQYQAFRKLISKKRSKIEMCQNCTEGLKL